MGRNAKKFVYEKKIQEIVELRERVVELWERLDQSVIDCLPSAVALSTKGLRKERGHTFLVQSVKAQTVNNCSVDGLY